MRKRNYIAASCMMLLCSCSPKVLQPIIIDTFDSVRVEVRERLVHDSVEVRIPVYVAVNTTRDSSSHLENPYAESTASLSDGRLYHELKTKPQPIKQEVAIPVSDTVWMERRQESINLDQSPLVEAAIEVVMRDVKRRKNAFACGVLTGSMLILLIMFVLCKVKNRLLKR